MLLKFSDFFRGQEIEAGPYLLSEDELLEFAHRYDPQWFHTDPTAAAGGPFGGLIASGWHTCCIAMRLVVDHVLAGSESYASPGLDQIRWRHPVRPGDTLRLQATVLEVRRSQSQSDLGILRWRWRLLNGHGTEVLDLLVTSLFKLSESLQPDPFNRS